jgi:sigma-B regulation protein RsbU (phosphoserine phosphatase)
MLYTDGVSEAKNPADQIYGIPRVRHMLARGSADVEGIARGLLDDMERFTVGLPQSDDICVVCFGRDSD